MRKSLYWAIGLLAALIAVLLINPDTREAGFILLIASLATSAMLLFIVWLTGVLG